MSPEPQKLVTATVYEREAQQRHVACCELIHDVACSAGEVRLRVTGGSMLPAVWPGNILTVRRCEFTELQAGQIVLYRRDGRLTAHRIHDLNSNQLITRGDSLRCFDPPVQASEIVGRVESIRRGSRVLSREQTISQRVVSNLLRHSDFLLRVTMALHRRLRNSGKRQLPQASPSPLPSAKR